jgi:hypothetical protein
MLQWTGSATERCSGLYQIKSSKGRFNTSSPHWGQRMVHKANPSSGGSNLDPSAALCTLLEFALLGDPKPMVVVTWIMSQPLISTCHPQWTFCSACKWSECNPFKWTTMTQVYLLSQFKTARMQGIQRKQWKTQKPWSWLACQWQIWPPQYWHE